MTWFDDYKLRLEINGENEHEIVETLWKENFDYYIDNRSADSFELAINNSNVKEWAMIKDNSQSEDFLDEKILSVKTSSTFKTGDFFNWKNYNWILTNQDIRSIDSHKAFFVGKCNNTLRFYNSKGKLIELPCIYNVVARSSSGISEDKYLSLIQGSIEIVVQKNTDTLEIFEGQRFLFDKKAYRQGKMNRSQNEGLIYFYMEFDEISDMDNLDLNIADYYSKDIYTLIINEGDISISSGNTKQLTTTVKRNDNTITLPITWMSSDENIATVDNSGVVTAVANGNVSITAKLTDNIDVNGSINVVVEDIVEDNYEIVVSPETNNVYPDYTNSYEVKLLNNGIEEVTTWTISIDPSTTALVSDYQFNTTLNQFSIKNLNSGKSVVIKMVSGNAIERLFIIRLKSWL